MYRCLLFTLTLLLAFHPLFVHAGEVVRGEDMADQGQTIEKTQAVTFAPHAELEYRLEDITIGNGNATADYPALALGVSAMFDQYVADVYMRLALSDNDTGSDYIDTKGANAFGITLAKTERSGLYWGLGFEYRDIEFYNNYSTTRDKYSEESYQLRPVVGASLQRKKWSNVVGGGLILSYGTVHVDYYNTTKGTRIAGDGTSYGVGVFVQNKFTYKITDSLSLPASLYWEGATSLSDPTIDGEDISSSYWNLGVRCGLQYIF